MSAPRVRFRTPARGLFYGGLVRRKNVLATIMHSFFILALISVQRVLWGYTLALGPDKGGLIGGLDWLTMKGVGQEPETYEAPVPHQAFMVDPDIADVGIDHDGGAATSAQHLLRPRAQVRPAPGRQQAVPGTAVLALRRAPLPRQRAQADCRAREAPSR